MLEFEKGGTTTSQSVAGRVRAGIRDIPDFPKPGIVFKDITPVLADPALFRDVVRHFGDVYRADHIDVVVGIESRGFILAAPLAIELGVGFVPVRKPGKLPFKKSRVDYDLEYGTDALEAHDDAFSHGRRTLLVDDVLATGGTAAAAIRLVEQIGGEVTSCCFLVELGFLNGRSKLAGRRVEALVGY
jgi:adenine phosphoribosyltransferase